MSNEDSEDSETTRELIESFLTLTHLEIRASENMPLRGNTINTKNLHLLKQKTVVLTEPFVDEVEELEDGDEIVTVEIDKIGHEPENTGKKKGKGKVQVVDTRRKMMLTGIQRKITDDDDFLTIATKKYPLSWHPVFANCKDFFKIVDRKLKKSKRRIVPNVCDIFRAFYLCPFANVKVIIVGQDPYYQVVKGQRSGQRNGERNKSGTNSDRTVACGLAFATLKGFPVQHSLKIIYNEIDSEYREALKEKKTGETENWYPSKPYKIPEDGDLRKWARQGVLLINMSLTTEEGKPGAHKHKWNPLLSEVIRGITRYHENLVFLLWGADARKTIKKFIIGKHHVLEAAHPAARFGARDKFQGCGHFVETNRLLVEAGKTPINW